jgi:tripartite-type tricarboxylate transporter receptor subunit TctC
MEYQTWGGFFAPAGTPRDVVNKLAAELVRVQARPELQAKLREIGFAPRGVGPEEFARVHRAEYQLAERLIKAAGITPE